MRSQTQRKKKYAAKLDGNVSKARSDADGDRQKRAFLVVSGDQVGVERLTKSVLTANGVMPGLNHFYMNFAKKLHQDKGMYSGATLVTEVCAERDHWELRGLSGAVLDAIIARMGMPACAVPPAVCPWSWKRQLTFSGNVSATNLDDFTVLVHLTNANFDFNKAQALGQDIRFMDSDTCPSDGTPLYHEIELWDKPGANAWIWVRVPRINGGTVNDFIYMFYGNAVAPDGQDMDNTWPPEHKGVYHHQADNPLPDSSGNGYNGVRNGTPTLNLAGKIQGGIDYDGTTDFYNLGDKSDFDGGSNLTVMGWCRLAADEDGVIASKHDSGATATYGWVLDYQGGPNAFSFSISTGGVTWFQTLTDVVSTTTWYFIAATYDGETMRIYRDGVERSNNPAPTGPIRSTAIPALIGDRNNGGFDLNGRLDEVRIIRSVRTADWIMAQWKSQDETLITYGAEQPA